MSGKRRLTLLGIALRIALAPGQVLLAHAQTIGMVADDGTDSVTVFEAESGAVLGSVAVGTGHVGDCSITDDQRLGFVTDFTYRVWAVDLSADPPGLAQPEPIGISNAGEDTALTADGRFLLVCDGLTPEPISVVDVASRTEVSTFALGSNCSAVEACSDGSVLVASSNTGRVHRLLLDDLGQLSHTGETLTTSGFAFRGPNNVTCAPDGQSGIVLQRSPPTALGFRIPGLARTDTRPLSGSGIALAGEIAANGQAVLRSDGGAVDVYAFDLATGSLGASPLLTFPVDPATNFLGIDSLAHGPDGRVWVSESAGLNAYDPATGALVGSVHSPAIAEPSGVCFARSPIPRNEPPDCDGAFPSRDLLWPPRGKMEAISIDGVTDPDGDPVEVIVATVFQDEPGVGRGDRCPDASGIGTATVELRSELDKKGNGRVYHVGFVASDGRGGECRGEVTVCVPRGTNARRSTCGDGGAVFDSTATCG